MKRQILFILLLLSSLEIFPQDTLLINADYIPHTDTTLVFYPIDYNMKTQYPLLFMLHGWSGNYAQWNGIVNLDSIANKYGFIIVCPDGFYNCWYINSPVKKNSQFETFFFKNLVPEIFNKYNIDKNNIFITGLSMGGHGAMYLFLRHPNFFKSAGSTSGILDITAFPNNWQISDYLGTYINHKNRWREYSDIFLLSNFKEKDKKIIVQCGTEDFAFNVNKAFDDSCKADGINISFFTGHGVHNPVYWKKSILKQFVFFKDLTDKR